MVMIEDRTTLGIRYEGTWAALDLCDGREYEFKMVIFPYEFKSDTFEWLNGSPEDGEPPPAEWEQAEEEISTCCYNHHRLDGGNWS
jgi:hypothetical protein